jgi:hypothetical protein
MFTGLVEGIGRITNIEHHGPDARLRIDTAGLGYEDVAEGESIAVNGVCLTAVKPTPGVFEADVSAALREVRRADGVTGRFAPALPVMVVLLFLLTGSVLLPLKAIVINVMSLTASYGALVIIFQEGNFSAWLGFVPMGYIEASLPILMFCVLFGLSMDYEVFLLSRMREIWDQTTDNREAVRMGLARSGRIITGAALIVVVVAASFVTAEVVLIKALGLGIAIAVALDATVVRSLVVPTTMRLFGEWNWWLPAWLERILPASPFDERRGEGAGDDD